MEEDIDQASFLWSANKTSWIGAMVRLELIKNKICSWKITVPFCCFPAVVVCLRCELVAAPEVTLSCISINQLNLSSPCKGKIGRRRSRSCWSFCSPQSLRSTPWSEYKATVQCPHPAVNKGYIPDNISPWRVGGGREASGTSLDISPVLSSLAHL